MKILKIKVVIITGYKSGGRTRPQTMTQTCKTPQEAIDYIKSIEIEQKEGGQDAKSN